MNYAKARENIKTGDVLGFSHTKSPFSSWYDFKIFMVRLLTRSEYSHVGIAVRFGGRVFVLESVTGGIRLEPLSLFLPCDHARLNEPFDLERAMSVCGQPYSEFEAMLGELGKTDDANGKWQCAEFVKWAKNMTCRATPAEVMSEQMDKGATVKRITA